jgi:hypothetical protein
MFGAKQQLPHVGQSDQEQEPRNPSTRIDPSMNECDFDCLLKPDCLRRFGWKDFDLARLDKDQCPVQGCSATLLQIPD